MTTCFRFEAATLLQSSTHLAGLIRCSDETGEASSSSELEHPFSLAKLITMAI